MSVAPSPTGTARCILSALVVIPLLSVATPAALPDSPPGAAAPSPGGSTLPTAAHAPGADDAGPALTLSLEEALRRGEAQAPELLRARAAIVQAQARRPGAALVLPINPLASVMAGYRRELQPAGPPSTGVQVQAHLEQQVEIAGQRGARLRTVDAAIESARARADFARSETRALLRTAYVQAMLAESRVTASRERAIFADQLLRFARVRANLGAAGDVEVNLALIESGRVDSEVTDAQATRAVRLTELRALTGIPQKTALVLTTPMHEPPRLPETLRDLGALIGLAQQNRADLRSLQHYGRELSADRSRLRREAVPSPIVALDFQRDLPGQEFYGGTLGLPIPLWNRNQGPLAQNRAAETTRMTDETLLLRQMHAQVAQAFRVLRLRRDQAQRFRDVVLPPAERNVDLLRRGWQAGKFDLFRVIAASRELTDTRLRYYAILEDFWTAALELERAVGVPLLTGGER